MLLLFVTFETNFYSNGCFIYYDSKRFAIIKTILYKPKSPSLGLGRSEYT